MITQLKFSGTPQDQNYTRKICEPSGPESEHLISSLIKVYKKLKEIGFVYSNGTISVIDFDEPEQNGKE